MSEWGRYGTGNGSLNSPQGIALDQSGNVYVADTANNRIQVFSSDGTFITKWGEYSRLEEGFRSPHGIAVDSSSGNVYVADTANDRISVFTPSSHIGSVTLFSREQETFGNDTTDEVETTDEMIFPGIF